MWELISSVRSWSSRHKRVLQCAAVAGGAAAGYVLYKKLAPIVSELTASYKLLRQMEKDLDAEREKQSTERLRYQFEQTHEAARLALGHVSVELREHFDRIFAVNTLKERLRQKSDEGARAEARIDEFKVAVIARTFSMLYSLCLCCVVLRLQLCIAARYAATSGGNPRQHQINSVFLGMIQFFTAQGSDNIARIVSASITERLSAVAMQTVLDRRAFESLMDEIRAELAEQLLPDCARFFIPVQNEPKPDHILSQMRSELAQLLSSQSIDIVLKASLQIASRSLRPVYEPFAGEGNPEVIFGRTLPKFAYVFETELPRNAAEAQASPLLDALSASPELSEFSSIVFFPIGQRSSDSASSVDLLSHSLYDRFQPNV